MVNKNNVDRSDITVLTEDRGSSVGKTNKQKQNNEATKTTTEKTPPHICKSFIKQLVFQTVD